MGAASKRPAVRGDVRGSCPYLASAILLHIFDSNSAQARVSRFWPVHIFKHGSMGLTLGCGPGGPADEPVDCVAALRLVQWELVPPPVEFVAAILQPVRPRDQHLTPTRGAHFVRSISVDEL